MKKSIHQTGWRWLSWLVVLGFVFGSSVNLAVAQSEPTLNQVFDAARAGRLDQAQTMMKQVLTAHPNSAKAHFVQAELLAQQGRLDGARASLATAERLAPGLPFASATAVDGLRARLSGSGLNGLSGVGPRASGSAPASPREGSRAAPPPSSSSPSFSPGAGSSFGWLLPVLLVGGGVAVFLMMRRRRAAAPTPVPYPGSYNAPQPYGVPGSPGSMAANPAGAGMPQPFGQGPGQPGAQPYAQPGQPYAHPYAQQAQPGSGLGGRIAGGLATGAAIGAGMLAVDAIARNMGGGSGSNRAAPDAFSSGDGRDTAIPAGDLGGDNFGVSGSSWDDAGGMTSSDVGGGDWDT